MNPNAIIPSMFHRRLTLLMSLVFIVFVTLTGQLYNLTVVHGAENRGAAEAVLVETELLPTLRGRILDRNGRTLAGSEPCFDLLVDYRVISGEWVIDEAWRAARALRKDDWNELSPAERQRVVDDNKLIEECQRRVEWMWRDIAAIAGVPLSDVEKRRAEVFERVDSMAQYIWKQWAAERAEEYNVHVSIEEVDRPIREQRQPHVILSRIDSGYEAEFRRLARDAPQIRGRGSALTLRASGARIYPWREAEVILDRSSLPAPIRSDEPLAVYATDIERLIVGVMREDVYKEDIDRRPLRNENGELDLGGYLDGDHIGGQGIEASCETELRGSRGQVTRWLDSNREERIPPEFGADVQLTLDIELQARITAMLRPEFGLTRVQPWHGKENQLPIGTPLDAAVVVIDVQSSEVLAAVSSIGDAESLAPFLITAENVEEGQEWKIGGYSVGSGDPLTLHRAFETPYPPGSIVKPLMLCAAASNADWSVSHSVDCQGHFFPGDRDSFRCWLYRPPVFAVHGPLSAAEAIARSCNIYFYTIARTLGAGGIRDTYRMWGLDPAYYEYSDHNIGVRFSRGILQDAESIAFNEVIMMGIGQGPVEWTPLHAANAYAALARGGYFLDPLLIRSHDDGSRVRIDLGLDDQAVYLAHVGLNDVVNNQRYGGARHLDTAREGAPAQLEPIFNADRVHVWGKTGTAQQRWPTRIIQYTSDGQPVLDENGVPRVIERESAIGSHSWFVGLAGAEAPDGRRSRPQFAIAVLVEWGGSGSRCAAPIANQVTHALVREGYLP